MAVKVLVYFMSNNQYTWVVESMSHAREYAKRIITEGAWVSEGFTVEVDGKPTKITKREVFYPPHQVYKVKVWEE